MSDPGASQGSRREDAVAGVAAALFSFALGLSAVAIPLLALQVGYGPGQVGVLVAVSAAAQLSVRSVMGALMRRFPDKYFVMAAGVLMALSCGVLLVSTVLVAFVLCQLAQGAARGFFWTGTQTHAVRTSASSVAAIARVNLTSGVGQIVGPLVAGPVIAAGSPRWALGLATLSALLLLPPCALMARLPPLRPSRGPGTAGAVWRRRGVGVASWAGASAGAWRAMMNSFVPILLEQARHSPSTIGILVAAGNAASIAGGAAAGRITPHRLGTWLVGGVAVTGLGLAAFGALAGYAAVAGAALAVSGIAAGVMQTVGPALASEAVEPLERGEAIATAGTFRAAALLLAPLGVAGLVALTTTPVAIVVAGVAMSAPSVLARGRVAGPALGSTRTGEGGG